MANMPETDEFTIDELAARARMTVRNVRSYATRGLIDPPRLEGRTGYYGQAHLQRLHLIRELLDRGYTLAAVENALQTSPDVTATYTLDLLGLLNQPRANDEPETMTRDGLAALAGVERSDDLIDALAEYDLAEWVDDDHDVVRLKDPGIVRAGAAAASMGLDVVSVIRLYPSVSSHLRTIADEFVNQFADDIIAPFIDADAPPEEWTQILARVEDMLPVALSVTLNIFRQQLVEAIDSEISKQMANLVARYADTVRDKPVG